MQVQTPFLQPLTPPHPCPPLTHTQKALLSAKSAARPLLQPLIRSVLSIFQAGAHTPCLDVLACVVELFGEVGGCVLMAPT